jgi:hypothetical protein
MSVIYQPYVARRKDHAPNQRVEASPLVLDNHHRCAPCVGMGIAYSHHDFIEGLDRHQEAYTSPTGINHEAITRDGDLTDQRLKLRLFSEAPLPITDVTLGVSLDFQRRSGTAPDLQRAAADLRWGVHARYTM